MPRTMLRSCLITFKLFLGAKQRLWKVRDPGSKAYFGVGSCTFMGANSFRALGGHARVALRPDEDLRLGQLVKMSGMRSAFLEGEEMIACPWYHSLGGLVRGVEKNLFAALDYSLLKMVSASAGLIWLTVAPIVLAPLLLAAHEVPAGVGRAGGSSGEVEVGTGPGGEVTIRTYSLQSSRPPPCRYSAPASPPASGAPYSRTHSRRAVPAPPPAAYSAP